MDSTFDLLLAVLFLGLGVAFRMGKLADLVLGKDPDVRKKYNEEVCMRYFSLMMFVLSVCSFLLYFGGQMGNQVIMLAGMGLNLAVIIVGIAFFIKSPRFRK